MKKDTFDRDGTLIETTISSDQQNSIEISQNAKGDMSFKVKAYHDDNEVLYDLVKDLLQKAQSLIKEGDN